MLNNIMDLSIIIVNWNTKDLLVQCLKSVFEHTSNLKYEVFVIDNASTDGSAEEVKKMYPQVKLIENKNNLGFAKANNQGVKESSAKYVLLLNSDTRVFDNTIENMIKYMESHFEVGASGCKLLNADKTIQNSIGKFPTFIQSVFDLTLPGIIAKKIFVSLKPINLDLVKKPIEVECIAGAFLLIRKEVIDNVGMLDEKFFIYSEDIDWCYRIVKAGWKIHYVPDFQIIHYWGKSSEQVSAKMFVELYKAKFQFWGKHYSSHFVNIMKCFLFVDSLLKTLFWCILYVFKHKKANTRIILNYQLIKKLKQFVIK